MKKLFILTTILLISGICFNSYARTGAEKNTSKGEQLFLKHADECLIQIENAAKEISITGVAVVSFIPDEVTESWISKMKVVGKLADDKSNLCAIAYSKSSEMAVTLKDSGDSTRKSIDGELGYQGGAIIKVKYGYLLAAFSGATGQQDYDVSKIGLEWFAQKFK
jgi:hypothetical protein